MAEGSNDQGQEKTEKPTGKRLTDAKKRGQLPRSRELNTTFILVTGALMLLAYGSTMGEGLSNLVKDNLRIARADMFDNTVVLSVLTSTLVDAFTLLIPFFLVLFIAVFLSPIFTGGFNFSTKAMVPKFSKLNPLTGIKRIFSVNGLMELVKAIAKIALVGGIAAAIIWDEFDQLMLLGQTHYEQAYTDSFQLLGISLLLISAVMIIIASIDVPFQLWSHIKKLKMTKQEIKEERKTTEGNPEVKNQVRRMQQEMAMRRMMEAIPDADVVVTNPTHYAVALKYDETKRGAPKVVAKGSDLIAARIREIASEHRIPIFEAPPLARAIYFSTDLDAEIPTGLYLAVAQVLAYVYQLKKASTSGGQEPTAPSEFDIPDEFLKHPKPNRPH